MGGLCVLCFVEWRISNTHSHIEIFDSHHLSFANDKRSQTTTQTQIKFKWKHTNFAKHTYTERESRLIHLIERVLELKSSDELTRQ